MRIDPYGVLLSCFIIAAGLTVMITTIQHTDSEVFNQPEFEEMNFVEQIVFEYPTAIVLLSLALMLFLFRLFSVL